MLWCQKKALSGNGVSLVSPVHLSSQCDTVMSQQVDSGSPAIHTTFRHSHLPQAYTEWLHWEKFQNQSVFIKSPYPRIAAGGQADLSFHYVSFLGQLVRVLVLFATYLQKCSKIVKQSNKQKAGLDHTLRKPPSINVYTNRSRIKKICLILFVTQLILGFFQGQGES